MLFSRYDLQRLFIPLLLEQVLGIAIGMTDTLMVSAVSEAAVSAVSSVDTINVLLINLFSSLATGGAVVASQYLGKNDFTSAGKAGKQLIHTCIAVSFGIMIICLLLNHTLLALFFGQVHPDVMLNARTYFLLSALSFPFLSLYNANAALLRAQGNTKSTLYAAIIINIIHIATNYLFIYVLKLGVMGAGISTLLSRILGALLTTFAVVHPHSFVPVSSLIQFKCDKDMLRRILHIGIPTGLEGSFFQLGKILLQSLTSSFGTAALAANAVANSLAGFQTVPANAIGLGIVTVIGRCVGAGEYGQARIYTKKLMKLVYMITWGTALLLYIFLKPSIALFHLSDEAAHITYLLLISFLCNVLFTWPAAFTLPNALRAAGDAKYTMIVASFSMVLFRILFSYILGNGYHLGVLGIWIASQIDWFFRGLFFYLRYHSNRWLNNSIV